MVDSSEHAAGVDTPTTAVRIFSETHRVRVIAEERRDVDVEGLARVRRDVGSTTIDDVRGRLTVRLPAGTDVAIGATSGRVRIEGPVGGASVVAGTGSVKVDQARSLDVRAGSGRVEVGDVEGDCHVRIGSGRVVVDRCGSADVAGDSGRIEVREAFGPVHAHCVSGRVDVNMMAAADVDAETVSGAVNVFLPPGVTSIAPEDAEDTPLETGECCVVSARSVRGRVTVDSR